MNFELKIAWKYFRGRRKSLARFTATVAILGIACGVASLIVAQALTQGFKREIREKILSHTAHITIFQTGGGGIQNWRIIKRELEKIENVGEITPTTYESAVLVGEESTNYAVLRAVKSEVLNSERETSPPNLKPQTPDFIEIAIGAELAEKMGLKIGDEAKILLPPDAVESSPKTFTARVRNTFRTGLYDYDSTWIYISFEDSARLQEKIDFIPTILGAAVKDIYESDVIARRIRGVLPADYKVLDWQEANRPLFAALSLERKIAFAIISLVIFIAVLNVTTTLAILVGERRLDIAILRTCGARSRSLIFVFLLEGLFLGLMGTVAGVVLGLAVCFVANHFRLISLPGEIYSLSHVTLIPTFGDIFLIVVVAFLLTLAATVYPAWQAAKIKPLENLRNS